MKIDPFPKPFSCKEKAQIHYPCAWLYKVIGSDENAMRKAIQTVCGEKDIVITRSHTSSGGKYCSLNVEVLVENDDIRLGHYQNLTNHVAIKVVM